MLLILQTLLLIEQASEKFIVACHCRIEYGKCLVEPGADALAQFIGGGIGKADHENFARLATEQDMTQIEIGNGIGLAGSSAGFNQAGTLQFEIEQAGSVEELRAGHSFLALNSSCV